MAHSSNEYMRKYLKKHRLEKAIEKHQNKLESYTGRRKEIYEQLKKTTLPELDVIDKKFNDALVHEIEKFAAEDIKLPTFSETVEKLREKGFNYEELSPREKEICKQSFDKQMSHYELAVSNRKKEILENMMQKLDYYNLKSKLNRLKMMEEGIELKIIQEQRVIDISNDVRKIVQNTLWKSLVDNVTEQVKKELSK